ncbi:MAG: hypothetical protein IH623_21025 [Verrucomicrobia bacterium]|nr:hypothetical protein [Verrucomicrobiota bacterium]
MGWATVTHPFHPLRGRRFPVLKVRRAGGREVLSLFDEQEGTISLPREWTDQAPPSVGLLPQAPILHPACLIQLRELTQLRKKRIDDAQ